MFVLPVLVGNFQERFKSYSFGFMFRMTDHPEFMRQPGCACPELQGENSFSGTTLTMILFLVPCILARTVPKHVLCQEFILGLDLASSKDIDILKDE